MGDVNVLSRFKSFVILAIPILILCVLGQFFVEGADPVDAEVSDWDGLEFVITVQDLEVSVKGYKGEGRNLEIPINIDIDGRTYIVTGIENFAFKNSNALHSVKLPGSLGHIGEGSFQNCSRLTEIVIPNGVLSIGKGAFGGCKNLQELTMPISLDEIVSERTPVFKGCTNIKKVVFTPGTGSGYDHHDHGLSPWHMSKKSFKTLEFKGPVDRIDTNRFKDCKSLKEVIFSDSISEIHSGAFKGCKSLKKLVLPADLTVIGNNAFYGCEGLEEVKMQNQLRRIEDCAFMNCKDLKAFLIPDSVQHLGKRILLDCYHLKEIYVSNGLLSMDKDAFFGVNLYDSKGFVSVKFKIDEVRGCTFKGNIEFMKKCK